MKKIMSIVSLILVAVLSQACSNNNSSNSTVSGRISKTIKCDMVIAGLGGNAGLALNGLQISATTAITTAGDIWATSEVIDNAVQYSGSSIYAAGEIGGNNPAVLVNADYAGSANGGYFDISVDRGNLGVSVIYTDSSLGAESPVVMSFSSANCTATNY